jgi:hypothetical protein
MVPASFGSPVKMLSAEIFRHRLRAGRPVSPDPFHNAITPEHVEEFYDESTKNLMLIGGFLTQDTRRITSDQALDTVFSSTTAASERSKVAASIWRNGLKR